MEYEYKRYEERTALNQYKNLLVDIMENGYNNQSAMVDKDTGDSLFTREVLGRIIRFDVLENGAPIITERDISDFYRTAIGELLGFINGARTQDELTKFGCKWWKWWLTPEKCAKRGLEIGDLGPGSYGGAFHDFPTADGKTFNQFEAVVAQMKERPGLKTHEISPWIPQYTIRAQGYQQKVVVCPCHGWLHFTIHGNKLHMSMRQRSCDTIIGLPSNWTQYTALLLAMADVLNLVPGEFIHIIENAHIYSNAFETAEELISREAEPFPTLKLVNHHDSIFDYRREDFELEDYHPKEKMKNIPVGI